MIKEKKGVSVIISYVLLIALALTLAAIVYAWLSSYAKTSLEEQKCPDGVNIRFEKITCGDGKIKLKIINNGLFSIAGFVAKYSKEKGRAATLPLDYQGKNEVEMIIGPQSSTEEMTFKYTGGPVAIIEILPFIYEEKGDMKTKIYCSNAVAKKELEGCF